VTEEEHEELKKRFSRASNQPVVVPEHVDVVKNKKEKAAREGMKKPSVRRSQ
jgi:hypothetical protein